MTGPRLAEHIWDRVEHGSSLSTHGVPAGRHRAHACCKELGQGSFNEGALRGADLAGCAVTAECTTARDRGRRGPHRKLPGGAYATPSVTPTTCRTPMHTK